MLVVNLGGEGEVPGVINQQGPWVVLDPRWRSSRGGKTFAELVADDHTFLICSNLSLPFSDESVDVVLTYGVPIDRTTNIYGPGVQSAELKRILKRGGEWQYDDGISTWTWTKP
jgi:hypothetical protein